MGKLELIKDFLKISAEFVFVAMRGFHVSFTRFMPCLFVLHVLTLHNILFHFAFWELLVLSFLATVLGVYGLVLNILDFAGLVDD